MGFSETFLSGYANVFVAHGLAWIFALCVPIAIVALLWRRND